MFSEETIAAIQSVAQHSVAHGGMNVYVAVLDAKRLFQTECGYCGVCNDCKDVRAMELLRSAYQEDNAATQDIYAKALGEALKSR